MVCSCESQRRCGSIFTNQQRSCHCIYKEPCQLRKWTFSICYCVWPQNQAYQSLFTDYGTSYSARPHGDVPIVGDRKRDLKQNENPELRRVASRCIFILLFFDIQNTFIFVFRGTHVRRTMLPKWPLWAHLFYSVSRRVCFRQARVAQAMLLPGALLHAVAFAFPPGPPNPTCARSHIRGFPMCGGKFLERSAYTSYL